MEGIGPRQERVCPDCRGTLFVEDHAAGDIVCKVHTLLGVQQTAPGEVALYMACKELKAITCAENQQFVLLKHACVLRNSVGAIRKPCDSLCNAQKPQFCWCSLVGWWLKPTSSMRGRSGEHLVTRWVHGGVYKCIHCSLPQLSSQYLLAHCHGATAKQK